VERRLNAAPRDLESLSSLTRRYNVGVERRLIDRKHSRDLPAGDLAGHSSLTNNREGPAPDPDASPTDAETPPAHPRHRIYAAETVGLLLISAVLLAITLIRYWHHLHGSAR